jgi:hypothetical protein
VAHALQPETEAPEPAPAREKPAPRSKDQSSGKTDEKPAPQGTLAGKLRRWLGS